MPCFATSRKPILLSILYFEERRVGAQATKLQPKMSKIIVMIEIRNRQCQFCKTFQSVSFKYWGLNLGCKSISWSYAGVEYVCFVNLGISDSLIRTGGVGEIIYPVVVGQSYDSRCFLFVFLRRKRSQLPLAWEQFYVVCCCQIAVNGAAGGLGVRWYNNMAHHFVTPAAPSDNRRLFHCHSVSSSLSSNTFPFRGFQNKHKNLMLPYLFCHFDLISSCCVAH